ncbi:hypothetical protein GW17_00057192 [Ensete ventricosum]|nr:hypothetical protein GW17_00057192 [Ensete ventricosum]
MGSGERLGGASLNRIARSSKEIKEGCLMSNGELQEEVDFAIEVLLVYKIHDAAVRGLIPIQGPLPVKFPLPDPQDPFLLRPGSLALHFSSSKAPEVAKTPNVSAAIAGARAAATTFSRDDQIATSNSYQTNETEKSEFGSAETSHAGTRKEDRRLPDSQNETQGLQASNCNQHTTHKERDENKRFVSEKTSRGSRLDPGASGKVSTTTS